MLQTQHTHTHKHGKEKIFCIFIIACDGQRTTDIDEQKA